ncbi:hypothetical protein BDW02DRAFT_564906 [Decorospora gaudefroyi]|uniref:Uncharacterized protein n=1 Tax=Decorospora gaudefroyi TaxID=184978 RepID=A0A6A5KVD4_9PLEO|nr:hypothetical protein BDW02DRAFT_564906 [Decorospora gaudefroyi]
MWIIVTSRFKRNVGKPTSYGSSEKRQRQTAKTKGVSFLQQQSHVTLQAKDRHQGKPWILSRVKALSRDPTQPHFPSPSANGSKLDDPSPVPASESPLTESHYPHTLAARQIATLRAYQPSSFHTPIVKVQFRYVRPLVKLYLPTSWQTCPKGGNSRKYARTARKDNGQGVINAR